jgi:HSP20 family molecular chaperone IbpA
MNRRFHIRDPFGLDLDAWVTSAFEDLDRAWAASQPCLNFPPANVAVTKDGSLILELAVAGYEPENIDITTEDDKVIVSSTRDQTSEEAPEVIYRGIKASSFKVYFPIPSKFDLPKIDAKFKNGLLTITIPVAEEKKPKKIEITAQ